MTIERYNLQGWADTRHAYRKDPEGEWMKYEDHEKTLTELEQQILELQKQNREQQ
jgi:hypothetical protein